MAAGHLWQHNDQPFTIARNIRVTANWSILVASIVTPILLFYVKMLAAEVGHAIISSHVD